MIIHKYIAPGPKARVWGILVLWFASFSIPAAAQSLTGTVTNGTTGKPASGDDVVLLSLANGMQETGRTKSDAQGKFTLKIPAGDVTPHLLRVIHQGVTYHRMATPGTTSLEITVYEVAKKVEGISVTADAMRLQAESNSLDIIRLFVVSNDSKPPKTQMNDQNFEFYLPDGAHVVDSVAETAGGKPINSAPVPEKEKNRFAFVFPLRPGQTRFQISYQLPYSGTAKLDPKSLYPIEHFGVMMPKSMKFSGPALFQSVPDPQRSDSLVEVAFNVQPNQSLAFQVSGVGTLVERNEGAPSGGGGGQELGAQSDNRPGGGIGPPIDAPDPLEKYRWPILGGFALLLAGGGYYITRRSPATAAAATGSIENDETAELKAHVRPSGKAGAAAVARKLAPPGNQESSAARSGLLLEALKEELFQLEVERQQGRITPAEYEKHKAALDHTLERVLQRETQKV